MPPNSFIEPAIYEAGVVAAAEVTIIRTPVVPPCSVFSPLMVMAMDLDHDIATAIEIGMVSGNRLIPVSVKGGTIAAGTSHNVQEPFVLVGGQGIYAKFTTPTAGDHLLLVATGIADRFEFPSRPGGRFEVEGRLEANLQPAR